MCVHIMGPYEAFAWQLSYLLLAIIISSAVTQAPPMGPDMHIVTYTIG